MRRRDFIKQTSLAGIGAVVLPDIIRSKQENKKIVILHTNDTHSNIDPFPDNHAKFPGMGGVSRRHTIIDEIREEEEHVLLLDCGDIFQGTPYFNRFRGVVEMKLMTEMGYDAATMGNHDFDIGLDGFKSAKQYANFPFICSNYDFSETILKDEVQQYKIFRKGGIKIGVFGIGVELSGLVPSDKYGKTTYLDPILTANKIANELKNRGCELIICLSHLGYEYTDSEKVSDRILAQKTSNIDLILGGHTHTFLDEPTLEQNKIGQNVLINQVGYAGLYLGRIDIDIHKRIIKHQKIDVRIELNG